MNVAQIREMLAELQLDAVIESSRTKYFQDALQELLDQPQMLDSQEADLSSLAAAIERLALEVDDSEEARASLFRRRFPVPETRRFVANRRTEASSSLFLPLSRRSSCLAVEQS
ncbi:hypothetical protein ACFSTC_53870 [Nonomuraea ferruginea]